MIFDGLMPICPMLYRVSFTLQNSMELIYKCNPLLTIARNLLSYTLQTTVQLESIP